MPVTEYTSRSWSSFKIHLSLTKTWKKIISNPSPIINFIHMSQSVLDFGRDHIRMALGWYCCFYIRWHSLCANSSMCFSLAVVMFSVALLSLQVICSKILYIWDLSMGFFCLFLSPDSSVSSCIATVLKVRKEEYEQLEEQKKQTRSFLHLCSSITDVINGTIPFYLRGWDCLCGSWMGSCLLK